MSTRYHPTKNNNNNNDEMYGYDDGVDMEGNHEVRDDDDDDDDDLPSEVLGQQQFLDLTNGEGGERFLLPTDEEHNDRHPGIGDDNEYYGDEEEEDDGEDGGGTHQRGVHVRDDDHEGGGDHDDDDDEDDDDDGHNILSEGTPPRTTPRPRSVTVDPNTPGRVVDAGQEHTGRWTKEEHEAFLSALKLYGKEWKKVAAKVKTRTVVQTRTHAQKYFQKLQKTMQEPGNEEVTQVDMGVAADAKKSQQPPQYYSSKKKRGSSTPLGVPKFNRRSSSTTLSAAQVISNLSASKPLTSFAAVGSSANMSGSPPRHGFFTDSSAPAPTWMASSSGHTQSSASSGSGTGGRTGGGAFAMKIVAPDPTASMNEGFFPEPSPAATGKRKLAEIAAARMLAGAAQAGGGGGGGGGPPSSSCSVDSDGPPTPPPDVPPPPPPRPPPPLDLRHAPAPPLFGAGAGENGSTVLVSTSIVDDGLTDAPPAAPAPRPRAFLQIVNPDALGVTHDAKRRRGLSGEGSPVTPWEGQLRALEETETSKRSRRNSKDADDEQDEPNPASHMGDGNNSGKGSQPQSAIPSVCGPGTAYGRSALHKAICDLDVAAVENLLSNVANQSEGLLQRQDELGYLPLHSACSLLLVYPDNAVTISALLKALLAKGADPCRPDSRGNLPLHWAARAGDRQVVVQLLLRNSPLDARNQRGETPLHWAMRAGRKGMSVVSALIDNGARPGVLNNSSRRPVDVAVEGFLDEPGSLVSLRNKPGKPMSAEYKKALKDAALDRKDTRANLLIRSAHSRTLILHHPECLEHVPKSAADWEAPDRVTQILRRIVPSVDSTGTTETSGIFPHEVTVSKDFDRAKLDLLSRVHSTEYLSFVNKLSKDLEKQRKGSANSPLDDSEHGGGASAHVVPFTPMVQRSVIKIEESNVKLSMNSDTSFSAGSLRAARRAAGAVQHAVDCVLVGRNRNAFCAVRPPGHHAGIGGLLKGGESCGFCIFNNVAAGALYAINDDRLLCDRCAIVDIDVHHGNGTEEIVRKFHDPSKLFFFSIHLYDNDNKKKKKNPTHYSYSFYPGTGAEDDLALNIINVPIVPLWKEVAPLSSSTPVRTHNTRHKARTCSQESQDIASETGTGHGSDIASDSGSTTPSMASPHGTSTLQSGRLAYRQAIQSRLLPALRAFNPDLILISAGFDAAKGDVGNARHERGGRERIGLDLEPEDYAWVTRKVLEIADICCQGRVVSVLEGGYGRTPLPGSAEAGSLDRTLFAECAVRHIHAMIDPYNLENRFSSL